MLSAPGPLPISMMRPSCWPRRSRPGFQGKAGGEVRGERQLGHGRAGAGQLHEGIAAVKAHRAAKGQAGAASGGQKLRIGDAAAGLGQRIVKMKSRFVADERSVHRRAQLVLGAGASRCVARPCAPEQGIGVGALAGVADRRARLRGALTRRLALAMPFT